MAEGGRWFEDIAGFLGPAYLRYSFTKGTDQEVEFLQPALGVVGGTRVLDVGCGPGRHANALAERGASVTGVDIAAPFLEVAKQSGSGAAFVRGDARSLPVASAAFDAVVCLCQGGFGLLGGGAGEAAVLGEIARVLRPGGRVALSAFAAYFAVRYLEESDTFDADAGVNHEQTTLRDAEGRLQEADLWTTCFTPRELRLLLAAAGLSVLHVWSVAPGAYGARPPDLDHPELLVVAEKPGGTMNTR